VIRKRGETEPPREGNERAKERTRREHTRGSVCLCVCVCVCVSDVTRRYPTYTETKWPNTHAHTADQDEERASRRTASSGRSMTSREFARDYRTPACSLPLSLRSAFLIAFLGVHRATAQPFQTSSLLRSLLSDQATSESRGTSLARFPRKARILVLPLPSSIVRARIWNLPRKSHGTSCQCRCDRR